MFGKSSNFSIRDVKRLKIVRNERDFNTINTRYYTIGRIL